MEQRLRIAYLPDEDLGNAYTLRMREILSAFGEVERFDGVKAALVRLLTGRWRRYDLLVANWIDNALLDPASGRIAPAASIKLFLRTLVMNACARKAAFVRHNNYPHATRRGSERLAMRLVDALERLFDVVITHSGAEAGRRRHYCPHPLYRLTPQAGGPGTGAEKGDLTDMGLPPRYFLVFGRLVPHKRIEDLMAAFPHHRNLVVAGAVGDAAYVEKLAQMQRPNLFLRPGFLSESRAQQLVAGADGVVISHGEGDVVVSGTFFYALSLGRPVFAMATPFLRWVSPRVGPALLHLADDLDGLCALIQRTPSVPVPLLARAAVQWEFGDDAVRAALAAALDI